MKIKQGSLYITENDRLAGFEIFDCNIYCNFKLDKKGTVPPSIFEIRNEKDFRTPEYLNVFGSVKIMTGCRITETGI